MRQFHLFTKAIFISVLLYFVVQDAGIATIHAMSNLYQNYQNQTMEQLHKFQWVKKQTITNQHNNYSNKWISDSKHDANVKTEQRKKNMETIKVTATGYTAGYESTGKKPNHPQYGITYSGVKVQRDKDTVSTIAADLKVFPIGTILYIPGYGYGVVADKGSAIRGNKIDLYFSTTKQVFKEWGKKDVEVQVIRKGTGKLTEEMMKELGKVMEVSKEIPDDLWDKLI